MDLISRLAGARVLVTGGAGFIGSHLVRSLHRIGASVRVLDDFSTGRWRNLDGLLDHIDLVQGSLTEPRALTRAVRDAEYVLHQAAIPSVPRSIEDPHTSHIANVEGTLTLLLAAREAGVRRLVYASSSSVYGDPQSLPVVETFPTQPLSPYAVQKLAAEQYCRVFHRVYGLETVCLRYFNVFGAGQDPTSTYAAVVPKIITSALEQRVFVVNGNGEQSRDFTHVDNVVHANLLALTAREAPGRVFNIACGSAISLNRMIEEVARLYGRSIEVEYGPRRTGDILHSLADISAAQEVLGYHPSISVVEGLKKTYHWFAKRSGRAEPRAGSRTAEFPGEWDGDDTVDERSPLLAGGNSHGGSPRI